MFVFTGKNVVGSAMPFISLNVLAIVSNLIKSLPYFICFDFYYVALCYILCFNTYVLVKVLNTFTILSITLSLIVFLLLQLLLYILFINLPCINLINGISSFIFDIHGSKNKYWDLLSYF